MQRETFAPILYVMRFDTLDEAIALNNGVPQGLSSAIFTRRRAHGRGVPRGRRQRLRHRQRQHRHVGRRDRRRVRRREGNRRRPRIRLRTRGRPTCAGRRTRSTGAASCRSRRASSSTRSAALRVRGVLDFARGFASCAGGSSAVARRSSRRRLAAFGVRWPCGGRLRLRRVRFGRAPCPPAPVARGSGVPLLRGLARRVRVLRRRSCPPSRRGSPPLRRASACRPCRVSGSVALTAPCLTYGPYLPAVQLHRRLVLRMRPEHSAADGRPPRAARPWSDPWARTRSRPCRPSARRETPENGRRVREDTNCSRSVLPRRQQLFHLRALDRPLQDHRGPSGSRRSCRGRRPSRRRRRSAVSNTRLPHFGTRPERRLRRRSPAPRRHRRRCRCRNRTRLRWRR